MNVAEYIIRAPVILPDMLVSAPCIRCWFRGGGKVEVEEEQEQEERWDGVEL